MIQVNLPNPDIKNKTLKEILDQIALFFEKDELKKLLNIHSISYSSFTVLYDSYLYAGAIKLNDVIKDGSFLTIRLNNYTLEIRNGVRLNEYLCLI